MLFTSDLPMATAALASNKDDVYLCSGTVTRIPKNGSTSTPLTKSGDAAYSCGLGIVASGETVTWICGGSNPDGGSSLCRWAPGSTSPQVVAGGLSTVRALGEYGTRLYWIEGVTEKQLVRADADGSNRTVLVAGGQFDVGSARIAIDATGVYWLGRGLGPLAGGSLFRVPLEGGAAEIVDRASSGERGISLSATEIVYVADGQLRVVTKADKRVRALRNVSTSAGYFFSRGISTDGTSVWIAVNAATGNQLMSVGRSDGTTKKKSEHPAMDLIVDVLADDDGVYEFAGGKVLTWPK